VLGRVIGRGITGGEGVELGGAVMAGHANFLPAIRGA